MLKKKKYYERPMVELVDMEPSDLVMTDSIEGDGMDINPEGSGGSTPFL